MYEIHTATKTQEPSEEQKLPRLPSADFDSSLFTSPARRQRQETPSTSEPTSSREFTTFDTEYLNSLDPEEWFARHLTPKTFLARQTAGDIAEHPESQDGTDHAWKERRSSGENLTSPVHQLGYQKTIGQIIDFHNRHDTQAEDLHTQTIKVHDYSSSSGPSRFSAQLHDTDIEGRRLSGTQRRRRSGITTSDSNDSTTKLRSSLKLDQVSLARQGSVHQYQPSSPRFKWSETPKHQRQCIGTTSTVPESVHHITVDNDPSSPPVSDVDRFEGADIESSPFVVIGKPLFSSSPALAKSRRRNQSSPAVSNSNIPSPTHSRTHGSQPYPRIPSYLDRVEAERRAHAVATGLSINDHCEALATLIGDMENQYKGKVNEDFDARMDGVKGQLMGLMEDFGSLKERRRGASGGESGIRDRGTQ